MSPAPSAHPTRSMPEWPRPRRRQADSRRNRRLTAWRSGTPSTSKRIASPKGGSLSTARRKRSEHRPTVRLAVLASRRRGPGASSGAWATALRCAESALPMNDLDGCGGRLDALVEPIVARPGFGIREVRHRQDLVDDRDPRRAGNLAQAAHAFIDDHLEVVRVALEHHAQAGRWRPHPGRCGRRRWLRTETPTFLAGCG